MDYAHSERAVLELNGRELDSRTIRVEKARRANGYEKTPGRCKIRIIFNRNIHFSVATGKFRKIDSVHDS